MSERIKEEDDPFISILVVNIDYTLIRFGLENDFSIDQNKKGLKPIIRIFGSTSMGQRVCLYVHGVYPYIFFRPDVPNHAIFDSEEKLSRFLPVLEKSLEDLLHMKRVNNFKGKSSGNQEVKRRKHIYKLEIVKKKSLYGFWAESSIFVKVSLHDPGDITRLASVLDEGSLAGIQMQPFESHIPFLLQFTSDFNIPPMGWIHLNKAKFRSPLPEDSTKLKNDEKVQISVDQLHPSPIVLHLSEPSQQSSTSLPLTQPSTSDQLLVLSEHQKVYTQKTVDPKNIWTTSDVIQSSEQEIFQNNKLIEFCDSASQSKTSTPNPINNILYPNSKLKIEGEINPIVLEIFDGLSESDIFSTQNSERKSNQGTPSTIKLPLNDNLQNTDIIADTRPPKPSSFEDQIKKIYQKHSRCELELDCHCDFILNQLLPRSQFGAELWEEERLRCEKKGIPFEKTPIPPATQTIHRPFGEVEKELHQRHQKLLMKGLALRKMAAKIVQSKQKSFNSSELSESEGQSQKLLITGHLSQYVTESEKQNIDQSLEMNELDLDEDMSQWVYSTIQQAELDAEMHEETFFQLSMDSNVVMEDYLKSQRSQHESKNSEATIAENSSENYQNDKILSYEEDLGEDDEGMKEIENIILSTQNNSEDNKNNTLNPNLLQSSPNLLPSKENLHNDFIQDFILAPEDVFADAQSSFLSKPPLVPSYVNKLSEKPAKLQNKKSVSFNVELSPIQGIAGFEFSQNEDSQDNILSLDQSQFNLSQSVSKSFKKRSFSGDKKLSSLFKKPKYSPSSIDSQNSMENQFPQQSNSTNQSLLKADIDLNTSDPIEHNQKKISPSLKISRKVSFYEPYKSKDVALNLKESPLNIKVLNQFIVAPPIEDEFEIGSDFSRPISISESILLAPSFCPPKVNELTSLDEFQLPLVINPPAHFTQKKDYIEEQKTNSNNSDYMNYMKSSHKIIYPQIELLPFDAGRMFLSQIIDLDPINCNNLYQKMASTFYPTELSKRFRCLIPTISPPKPSAIKAISFIKGPTALNPPTNPSQFTQIRTPTQTPGSANKAQDSSNSASSNQLVGQGNRSYDRMARMVVLSMELHCNTRKDLLPNPKFDAIQMIIWVADDIMTNAETEFLNRLTGVIIVVSDSLKEYSSTHLNENSALSSNHSEEFEENKKKLAFICKSIPTLPKDAQIQFVDNEAALFDRFFGVIQSIDPDFLVGYENQGSSYGYFIKRGKNLNINCLALLSRMPNEKPSFRNSSSLTVNSELLKDQNNLDDPDFVLPKETNDGNIEKTDPGDIGIFITGRTFFNLWQIMKSEIKLLNYSIQNVVEEVLHRRLPKFTCSQLTRWFREQYPSHHTMPKTIAHIHQLALCNVLLLEKFDLLRKLSESARLYGIDLYSVLNRGSQYRVEAALLLKARALGYILLSPSRQKVANQAPMEVIPLVMEPRSQFYSDPVIVLDFQSLYPSMMIAYNLCFSTCLGKLRSGTAGNEETTSRLGVSYYPESISAVNNSLHIKQVNDIQHIDSDNQILNNDNAPYIAPNGSIFCSKAIRQGILPMMVKEMLDTRIMVKRSLKKHCLSSKNKVLEKVLDARQLAIKLLANVTYGYTAAGFSGRMPMSELADAIVQSGRSLLQWTMSIINSSEKWKAQVVYGDTDSVFVHVPGRSLDQAFQIGEEIAAYITEKTHQDIVLKFEKVYYPCILVTKKRYVGRCFEKRDQEGHLDAKGIEMIRSDQCPITAKIQEKVIRLLFSSRDMSLVKSYLIKQWNRILHNANSDHQPNLTCYNLNYLKDFIFYKDVRFGFYSSVHSLPPGAIVSTKAVLQDEMAVPPYNWRVPYVVVTGLPNTPLKNLVHNPYEIIKRGNNLKLNYVYYITKCINPALDRILSLCGINVMKWYSDNIARPKVRHRCINYQEYVDLKQIVQNPRDQVIPQPMHEIISKKTFNKSQRLMDRYTIQTNCELCNRDALPTKNLCADCLIENTSETYTLVVRRFNNILENEKNLESLCSSCSMSRDHVAVLFSAGDLVSENACESLECEVFYQRMKNVLKLEDYFLAVQGVEQHLAQNYDIS